MAEEKKDSPFTLALIAGGCAGTTVDVALHPLDTLRTRLQSPAGFWQAGGFRGVYKGILSAALGSAPGAAAFFSTYESMKQLQKSFAGDKEHWTHHAFASSCGEVAACLVRVPTAVVTQRMQVGQYARLSEALGSTFANGGLGAFYVGYGTTVMREIPFAFIQFPIYERLKSIWSRYQGRETNPVQGAACGSIAGAIAGACTTPLDVAKTRIMLENPAPGETRRYSGTVSTCRIIATEEGVLALFKGIAPRVTWITIGGWLELRLYAVACAPAAAMWEPQDIYPTADGWCPPAWPTNEDDIKAEEERKQWPRRNLIKRTIVVVHSQMDTLVNPDFMESNKYSLQVYPLRTDTHFSGPGEERGYLCWVYYEPKHEQLVLRAWKSMELDLTQSERSVVDPDTGIRNEQTTMYSKSQVCHFNIYEWEVVKDGEEPLEYKDSASWP